MKIVAKSNRQRGTGGGGWKQPVRLLLSALYHKRGGMRWQLRPQVKF
jgi:hypothetical protein